jgi:hypothetical protein
MSELRTAFSAFGASNPSHAATVQVGCTAENSNSHDIPPGWPVWTYGASTGRAKDKITVGSMYPLLGDGSNGPNQVKLLGVSIDGIVDPDAAKKHPDACGRHSVAVSGNVKIHARLADGGVPPLLSELYVARGIGEDSFQNRVVNKRDTANPFEMPNYYSKPGDFRDKIGVVQWVNTANNSCEVTVQLQLH